MGPGDDVGDDAGGRRWGTTRGDDAPGDDARPFHTILAPFAVS